MSERRVFYSDTEPQGPSVGDSWIHTTTRIERLWKGTTWEPVFPISDPPTGKEKAVNIYYDPVTNEQVIETQ